MGKSVGRVQPGTQALQLTSVHERNDTSQCGEDGIVEAIFLQLGIPQGIAIEFGAWDGVRFSNTHSLIERNWRVLLIEGAPDRFKVLRSFAESRQNLTAINAWVTPIGENSLDEILKRAGIGDVDFLSVDINGDDYHILADLRTRPKVICVEFNPTIPPPVPFIGGLGKPEGSSLTAFDNLMTSRGFVLIYATRLNAFFIRGDLADRFVPLLPAECFDFRSARFVVGFFDGRNQIVDALGRPARAKNPWSGARAAIPLNLPSLKLAFLGAAVVLVVAIVLSW